MARVSNERIRAVFLENITSTTESVSWQDIVVSMKAAGFSGNWLRVRGVLQGLKDEGIVRRIDSIHVEEFVLTE